jgi:hypothetical protein
MIAFGAQLIPYCSRADCGRLKIDGKTGQVKSSSDSSRAGLSSCHRLGPLHRLWETHKSGWRRACYHLNNNLLDTAPNDSIVASTPTIACLAALGPRYPRLIPATTRYFGCSTDSSMESLIHRGHCKACFANNEFALRVGSFFLTYCKS